MYETPQELRNARQTQIDCLMADALRGHRFHILTLWACLFALLAMLALQHKRIKALEERLQPAPAQQIQMRFGEGQEPPAQEPDLA